MGVLVLRALEFGVGFWLRVFMGSPRPLTLRAAGRLSPKPGLVRRMLGRGCQGCLHFVLEPCIDRVYRASCILGGGVEGVEWEDLCRSQGA